MRKTVRICCFITGAVLLLSALFLVIYNRAEDKKSGETASSVLENLKREIPEYVPENGAVPGTMPAAEDYDLFEEYESAGADEPVSDMPTVTLDNYAYIGYISIPRLQIELPVLAAWSYPNLKISPCVYKGSLNTGDLIICAHNYNSHFGQIKTLHNDDEIILTDADGVPHRYTVFNIEELPGTAVAEMEFGDADTWDLTLFTCTLSGQSRVTVRACRAEE